LSEELQNSLFESIQSYVDERLSAIDEQLAKLQTDFNQSLAQLREQAASSSVKDSPQASVMTAHLQAAREQKLSGPAAPTAAIELPDLKRAIDELKNQRAQSDVLTVLLRNASQFADRVALFVIKGDQAIAWRMCEASDRGNLKPVSGVATPVSGNTVVSQAVRSGSVETASGTRSEDGVLIEQLHGEPQQLAALPLSVRGKVVGVLYADSAWPHHDAIQLDALEVLTNVAGMAVELASGQRAVRPAPVEAPAVPISAVSESPVEAAPEPVETVPAEEPAYIPQVEAQLAPEETQAVPEQIQAEAPPEQIETQVTLEPVEARVEYGAEEPPVEARVEYAAEESAAEPVAAVEAQPEVLSAAPAEPEPAPEMVAAPPAEPVAAPEVPAAPPVMDQPAQPPVVVEQFSAPLGRSRRWGMPEADLPVEVSDEERRLHTDARRFARLLVSEIKLYNEQKVSDGRNQGDIYDRLRDDIDRSRQMYEKRVAPPVAARHDYFHQELVNTLAEGDPAKLGSAYPGAVILAAV
jgi:hypothetical protein